MKNNKTVVSGLLAVLLAASVSVSAASIIITDDFSNSVGPIGVGGTITPTYSAAGTQWLVQQGAFYTNGGPLSGQDAGQLGFGNTARSVIQLGFGDIVLNTGASIEFQLRQAENAAWANEVFVVEIGDSSTGGFYKVAMALNPNFWPAVGGGSSGFIIDTPTGAVIISGTEGAYFGNVSPGFYNMKLSFDPISGVSLTQNGNLVAISGSNPVGLTRIDYFKMDNNGSALGWYADNIVVDATLVPEPSTWMLLGLGFGAVVLFRRRRQIA